MKDERKTKAQLIEELRALRDRVKEMEALQGRDRPSPQDALPPGIEAIGLPRVLEAMIDPLLVLNMKGEYLYVNEAYRRLSGRSNEELVGLHHELRLDEVTKEEEREKIAATARDAFEKEPTPPLEFTFVACDGREVPVSAVGAIIRGERGEPLAVVVTFRDVTEQNRVEKTLRESEERFRALFEGSLDAIFLFDPESGRVLDANPAAEELLASPLEEIHGMHYTDLHPDHLRETMERLFERQVEEAGPPQPVETVVVSSGGAEVPVELLAQLIQVDGVPVLLGTYRNLTERRRAERALRRSEERHRFLLQNAPDVTAVINRDNTFRYISPAVERVLGYTPEEAVARLGFHDIHPEDRSEAEALFTRLRTRPNEVAVAQCRLRHKDGSWRFIEAVATNAFENPAINAIILNCRDITERKRLEEALRRSEERHRLLVQNSSDLILLLDENGAVRYASPALERSLGYTHDEMIGACAFDYIHPDDLPQTLSKFRQSLEAPGIPLVLQYRFRYKDGSWRVHESVGNNLLDHPALGSVIVNCRDITERKKMEEALLKVQKLESLGILCGGIAHDFNNILTAILTNISLARMYGDLEEETMKMLADAERASLRGQGLTRRLLTFAKGGEPIRQPVSVQRFLKETIEFALTGTNVGCRYEIDKDLLPVDIDEGQIGQVVHNLVLNAQQAMPKGGHITVRARNLTVGPEGEIPTLAEGDYVEVSITDEGIGIEPEHLPRIFDPFYTTKEHGTGLGLSTSYSIVSRHGGTLQIQSEPGRGTTVYLYLPASKQPPAGHLGTGGTLAGGKGRILLVDDDDLLRRSTTRALRRLGYEVLTARDGAAGIEAYRRSRASDLPVDAVVMDLTIPGGMGGLEATRRLLEIDPEAKVIASSGYSNDPIMSDARRHGFRGVVTKPYLIEDLHNLLLEVIQGKG